MPIGAVYVGRPTVYGNPWTLADAAHLTDLSETEKWQWIVDRYERELRERGGTGEDTFIRLPDLKDALRGRDLACWCPPGRPCHADVLLRVANAPRVVDVQLPDLPEEASRVG